ncbi:MULTISPECIES: glycosyltransferase family 2 protein [unclassified Vibrio]|uniref:Glycosyltransferase n=1 Tax=Vibrio sp. HB236076 TaxID=3232307 RepID=A0AB39HGU3_9VIBR|nr:glycosyltransferase [Vibrio sp. HB161653]MDP5254326.1 glycosyltransferase [Vibrio sp. HB161653]
MKRLILHVGLHKTATSSIQQTLAGNAKALSQQHWFYPIFYRHDQAIINHSIPFYSLYCSQPEHYHINIKNGDSRIIDDANRDYQQQIEQLLNMETNIILSGEDISMLPQKALQALKENIVSKGFDLTVFCSVRKPYRFTCSELQERIKSANGRLDNLTVQRKSDIIETLQSVFTDNMVFCNFEQDAQTEPGAVMSMLLRMGLDTTDFTLHHSNQGFGNLSTRFLAHLNQTHPTIIGDQLNQQGRGFFSHSVDEDTFLLTEQELDQVQSTLNEENQRLHHLLGPEYCDKDYATIDAVKLDLPMAKKLIEHYTNAHTLIAGVDFILQHASISAVALVHTLGLSQETCYRLALTYQTSHIRHAFAFIAMAKKAAPTDRLIAQHYERLKTRFLATIKLGIGIVTYNRLSDLKKTVNSVIEHTGIHAADAHPVLRSVRLFVADDGSSDNTSQWCRSQGIACSQGVNRGVVRNKNRALYYLHHQQQCDVTILLEDDCRPIDDTWFHDWVVASFLWGHINFAHQRIIKKEGAVFAGNGQAYDPFACRLVTGQCTGCYCDVLEAVGYLDPRFEGYGAGHVEWTERFVKHGHTIIEGYGDDQHGVAKKITLFPAIDHGLLSQDAPTFKNEAQLKRNQALKQRINHQTRCPWPWKDEAEKVEFLADISEQCVDQLSAV